jgi:hypothetical protein
VADLKTFIAEHTAINRKKTKEIVPIMEEHVRRGTFTTGELIDMHRLVRALKSGVCTFRKAIRAAIFASVKDREGARLVIGYFRTKRDRSKVVVTCAPYVTDADVLEYKAQSKRRGLREVGRMLETERRRKKIE